MFIAENHDIKPSEAKILLSSPTMHPESRMYMDEAFDTNWVCLLYTSPSPRDRQKSRMPSSA